MYYYNAGTGQSSWTPPPGSKVTSEDDGDSDGEAQRSEGAQRSASKDGDSGDEREGPEHANGRHHDEIGKRGRHVHKLKHYSAEQAAKSLNNFLGEQRSHVYLCVTVSVKDQNLKPFYITRERICTDVDRLVCGQRVWWTAREEHTTRQRRRWRVRGTRGRLLKAK